MALHSPETGSGTTQFNRSWAAINRLMRSGKSWSGREKNVVFLGKGDAHFVDASHIAGLNSPDDGRGVAPVDWDNDGDLDLWMNFRSGPRLRLMRNNTDSGGHWLRVRPSGVDSNRDAIGTRVTITTSSGAVHARTVRAGNNYKAQRSRELHFGFGVDDTITAMTVRWPNGAEQVFTDVPIDRCIAVIEDAGEQSLVLLGDDAHAESVLTESPLVAPERTGHANIPLVHRISLPEVSFKTFASEEEKPVAAPGRIALINLWASWCAPCVRELNDFNERRSLFESLDVDLIALSVDEPDAHDAARKLAVEIDPWFAMGFCPQDLHRVVEMLGPVVLERYEPAPLPLSVLVDADGRIARIYHGAIDLEGLEVDVAQAREGEDAALNHISRAAGIWHGPEAALRHATWHRSFAVLGELSRMQEFELAAMYAGELQDVIRANPPSHGTLQQANSAVARVVRGLRAVDPARALPLARTMTELEPDHTPFVIDLLETLAAMPDPEHRAEAVERYETLLTSSPEATTAAECAEIGSMWLRLNQPQRAVEPLRRAVALAGATPAMRADLGLALIGCGDDAEGARELEAGLRSEPGGSPVRLVLANALDRVGSTDRAAVHYRRYLADAPEPQSTADFMQLSAVAARLGEYDTALAHLQAAAERDPADQTIQRQIGAILLETGRAAEAVEALTRAVEGREPTADDLSLLGIAHGMSGRPDRALAHFEEALAIAPDHADALRNRGLALESMGRFDESIADYERYLAQRPGDLGVLERLSILQERFGREAGALTSLQKLAEHDARNPMHQMRLALLLASAAADDVRDGTEALAMAETLQQAMGDSPLVLDVLAAAYAENGRFDEAVATAELAVEIARQANQQDLAASIESRLELYRVSQPFRRR